MARRAQRSPKSSARQLRMPLPVILGVRVRAAIEQLRQRSLPGRPHASGHLDAGTCGIHIGVVPSSGRRRTVSPALVASAGVPSHAPHRRARAPSAGSRARCRDAARAGAAREPRRCRLRIVRTRRPPQRRTASAPRRARATHSTNRSRARVRSRIGRRAGRDRQCRARRRICGRRRGAGENVRARSRRAARAACSNDLACFLSCSRFGRSGSGDGICDVIGPPCLRLGSQSGSTG